VSTLQINSCVKYGSSLRRWLSRACSWQHFAIALHWEDRTAPFSPALAAKAWAIVKALIGLEAGSDHASQTQCCPVLSLTPSSSSTQPAPRPCHAAATACLQKPDTTMSCWQAAANMLLLLSLCMQEKWVQQQQRQCSSNPAHLSSSTHASALLLLRWAATPGST
jgi:hypothetical protein